MARPRADTGNFGKEPHSLSLKVLRLSRPSLALQYPLPRESDILGISRTASLAFPSDKSASDQEFIISSNLSLPPAFGSAHVGETFACSLCANNELKDASSLTKKVSGVRIVAEMQTPSQTVPLQLFSAADNDDNDNDKDGDHNDGDDGEATSPGDSSQKIIRFDLKEEGNHVLAVNLSYTETITGDGQATSGRVRSFRKLYQFMAQPCLSVRTKATEMAPKETTSDGTSQGSYGRSTSSLLRYALEAQLENVSENTIVLEHATIHPKRPFRSISLNWDADLEEGLPAENPVLNPRDVVQVAFLLQQEEGVTEGLDELKTNIKRDGRGVLGQLSIQWRGSMGEKGSLSTGNLMTRRKL